MALDQKRSCVSCQKEAQALFSVKNWFSRRNSRCFTVVQWKELTRKMKIPHSSARQLPAFKHPAIVKNKNSEVLESSDSVRVCTTDHNSCSQVMKEPPCQVKQEREFTARYWVQPLRQWPKSSIIQWVRRVKALVCLFSDLVHFQASLLQLSRVPI